jgi:hypothetical protein
MNAVFAGLAYYAVVFAFAFAMGVGRTLVVAPAIGSAAAVGLEIPVVLGASWFTARALLRGRSFGPRRCAIMGLTAFAMTMASEAALSAALRGQGLGAWVGTLATAEGLMGLLGQVAFAVIPLLARDRPDATQGAAGSG